jgi:hypothetical protein
VFRIILSINVDYFPIQHQHVVISNGHEIHLCEVGSDYLCCIMRLVFGLNSQISLSPKNLHIPEGRVRTHWVSSEQYFLFVVSY